MHYTINSNLKINLVELTSAISTKVISISIQLNQRSTVEILLPLEDLKNLIGGRFDQKINLTTMSRIISYLVKRLTKKFNLKLSVITAKLIPQTQIKYVLQIIEDNVKILERIGVNETGYEAINFTLATLHKAWLTQESLLFNTKMKYPVIIGRTFLNKSELKQLNCGNVILMDELLLLKNKLLIKIGNSDLSISFNK